MIVNQPLAPEYHTPIGRWFENHFAYDYIVTGQNSNEFDRTSFHPTDIVSEAKPHLECMLTMNAANRRRYVRLRGCTDTETAYLTEFQSYWVDTAVRKRVTEIALECVDQNYGFETLLNRWPGREETQRIQQLLKDSRITKLHLAISFTTCQTVEMAYKAFSEATEAIGRSEMAHGPLAPKEQLLPEILTEPSQPVKQQLKMLSNFDAEIDAPDVQALEAEHLDWLISKIEKFWLPDMPEPFAFPADLGGLTIEWFIGHVEHSLDIDFGDYSGRWTWWNSKSNQEYEELLDLKEADAWQKLQESSVGRRPTQ